MTDWYGHNFVGTIESFYCMVRMDEGRHQYANMFTTDA